MLLEKFKDWIAPIEKVEFKILEFQKQNEKMVENIVTCKRDENGKFQCKNQRGDIWTLEELSCKEIENFYKNKEDKLFLSCRVDGIERDYSRVYKPLMKGAATIAMDSLHWLTPLKPIIDTF
ncbi:MAG: hypothetical protein J7K95_07035 [Thermoplasmata archaeon]|nr:hypothetical protein [Thermoplasmata archaeon]